MSLIERLRNDFKSNPVLLRNEAASTLEAQQAQIAELREALENKTAELESLQEAVRDAGFKTEWVARK